MSTSIDISGVFPIPTMSPMNGPVLYRQTLSNYYGIVDLDGGWSIPVMAGIAAQHPEVQTMYSASAVGFRTPSGWEIYLPRAGVKLTADALISEGSIVQSPTEIKPWTPTFFEGGGGEAAVIPPFWTNFKNTSEDGFGGGGGGGWIPDDPPMHDGIFSQSIVLVDVDGYFVWSNSVTTGARITGVFTDVSLGKIGISISFGEYEHGIPVSILVSVPGGESYLLPVYDEYMGEFFFYQDGLTLTGALADGGPVDITAVVTFE